MGTIDLEIRRARERQRTSREERQPMNRQEHLTLICMEEAAELAQRLSKASRFGMGEIQEGQADSNRQRIAHEYYDLVAAMQMLGFLEVRIATGYGVDWAERKKKQVERFLGYSREQGTLQDPPEPVIPREQERLALDAVAKLPHAEPHILGGCARCAARVELRYADEFPPFVGEAVPKAERAGG